MSRSSVGRRFVPLRQGAVACAHLSYQVPLTRAVKAAADLPTIAVGLITSYDQAEAIVGTGDADFVALARTITYKASFRMCTDH